MPKERNENQIIKKKKEVQWAAILLPMLYLLSFIFCSAFARFSLGIDLSFLFIIIIIAYYFLFYKKNISNAQFYLWWIYLLLVPVLMMTIAKEGDLGNMLQCVLIFLLPIVLEPFVPEDNETIIIGLYFVVGLSLLVLFLYANFGFLKNWNTNCMGYLLFLGASALTILLAENRKNIFLWVLYSYSFIQLLVTDSRNVSLSILITIILLLLKTPISNKTVYRIVYIFAILYPVFFPMIGQQLVGTDIYKFLEKITKDVYDKGQGGIFSGRLGIFAGAEKIISESWFHYLFGYGKTMVSFYASHNDYYLLHYTFGLVGTLIIAGMLVYFFEKTYVLIQNGDNIAYGCFAIMISVLIQQASEGWFLATFLLTLMPFVYMAIVIKRYRKKERELLK